MIWVVVAGLNIATILVFGDEVAPEKALWPLFYAVVVPAAVYVLAWGWQKLRSR